MQRITDRQQRFLDLYEPVQPNLERFVISMTGDRELARDVVGETVMVAYEGFEKLRDRGAFLSWLFTIASRTCRRHQRRSERSVSITEIRAEMIVDPGTSPEEATDIERLYRALDDLPPRVREAVVLFELIGLPMNEIREIQGGTLTALKVRVSRGRRRLAEILGVDPPTRVDRLDADGKRRSDLRTHSIGAQL